MGTVGIIDSQIQTLRDWCQCLHTSFAVDRLTGGVVRLVQAAVIGTKLRMLTGVVGGVVDGAAVGAVVGAV